MNYLYRNHTLFESYYLLSWHRQ